MVTRHTSLLNKRDTRKITHQLQGQNAIYLQLQCSFTGSLTLLPVEISRSDGKTEPKVRMPNIPEVTTSVQARGRSRVVYKQGL